MQRRWSIMGGVFALIGGLCLLASPPATAQGAHPITLRLGGAFPVGDTDDTAVFTVGGEYDLPHLGGFGGATQLSVSLDWLEVTTFTPFKHDFSIVPLLFNARWQRAMGGRSIYYGAGLGIIFASNDPVMKLDDTNFGWQVFLGSEFTPRIRGDLRFIASDSPGDDGLFLVEVGYRL